MIRPLFVPSRNEKPRAAILMSGSGSNAEVLLRHLRNRPDAPWRCELLFTDRPTRCRAPEIAERYGVRLEAVDIFDFYAAAGESAIALTTPARRALREEWSARIAALFAASGIDFLLLAGFVPLSNVTERYPALNVHPGDLTVEIDGRRPYAGLHRLPVERALIDGDGFLRSSVILAQSYSGSGQAEMDSGPVLAVSEKMAADRGGFTPEQLREMETARGGKRAADRLSEIADANVERLKKVGDHVIFAPAADAFAAGRYGRTDAGVLTFDGTPCRSVEFRADGGWTVLPL